MPITITETLSNFEREPLIRPFGFKGGYMREIWQSVARMQSAGGQSGLGLCTQNALWSDAIVFANNSPAAAEAMMYAITDFALQQAKGRSFSTPLDLQEQLLPEVYAFAKRITRHDDLRMTFALNAMVGVDFAAWLLYAAEHSISTFDEMIPAQFRQVLDQHHERVAAIPLMAFGIPLKEIKAAVDAGYFFMKIKIGQPGTQEEMLEKDKARISAIHETIGHVETPHTANGKLPYYFDANGRYDSKARLQQLLDHADKIGALEQIALIEEPFPESNFEAVDDLGVRIAADESAHTDADTLDRIKLGYRAIALKPIAKTLSMTLKIADVAQQHNVPCFCADLTVNPILVDWNKNVAARLKAFPGLENMGLLETNGHQNYYKWAAMQSYHPAYRAAWTEVKNGAFELDADFYEKSGGIFEPSGHYQNLVAPRADTA